MKIVERQTIVTWYTPNEKKPPEGDIVVVSISGKMDRNVTLDHTFALAEWYNDGDGWNLLDIEVDKLVVHAWCDLVPYGS